MIDDSYPWKARLRHELRAIKRSLRKGANDNSYDAIEWFVFTTAFVIRKLNDSKRLSYEAEHRCIATTAFRAMAPRTGHRFTEKDINDRYDLNSGLSRQLSLEAMCNQMIHSYDFVVARTGGRGMPFSSTAINLALDYCPWCDYATTFHSSNILRPMTGGMRCGGIPLTPISFSTSECDAIGRLRESTNTFARLGSGLFQTG